MHKFALAFFLLPACTRQMAVGTDTSNTAAEAVHACRAKDPQKYVGQYPLIDALLQGRSRRFFKGAEIPNGPLAYKSDKSPEPLTLEEEALLAFAAGGINGYALAELPYRNAADGNGNLMYQFLGRTVASADAAQLVSIFITNDQGTWLLRRPQDLTPAEIEQVTSLLARRDFVAAYKMLRIQVAPTRTQIPVTTATQATFNQWSQNKPGTTLIVPVMDFTAIYLSVLQQTVSVGQGFMVLDDRKGLQPAGLGAFAVSQDGHLDDDPTHGKLSTVSALEGWAGQLVAVELGAIMQNLRLMSQALGLGGFPHFAAIGPVWQATLGFDNYPLQLAPGLTIPVFAGYTKDGKTLIKTYSPPYYAKGSDAVQAFYDFKFGPKGSMRDDGHKTAWRNPRAVKSGIDPLDDVQLQAMKAHVDYLLANYGQFPPTLGPVGALLAYQAHVLDPDFYDEHYRPEALTNSQRCRSGGY